jgi:uncharacterized protein YabN with tetrapyrrole methylase and pyrophosphatase domain
MKHESLYRADIFVVGIGLFGLNQLTAEAHHVLQSASYVMHLTSMHADIREINRSCEDLSPLYWQKDKAPTVYRNIATHIIQAAAKRRPVALAVDGNPLAFDDICWEVITLGKKSGFSVQAVPGISTIDVLPIQLGFDLGDLGTQIFDATQLVMFELQMNPHLSTLVLQVAEFGASEIFVEPTTTSDLQPLFQHLLKFYPPSHSLIFVRSRATAHERSIVLSTNIAEAQLSPVDLQPGATLYVPRLGLPDVRYSGFQPLEVLNG